MPDLLQHAFENGSVQVYHDQETGKPEEKYGDLSNLRMIFGERNLEKAALVADRELFQQIYRAMVRLASANGWDLHLVEFTFKAIEANSLSDYTDRFVEISAHLLRNCDVILKYNDRQVVFLLMMPENGEFKVPVDRVLDAWRQEDVSDVTISYQQEQVNEY